MAIAKHIFKDKRFDNRAGCTTKQDVRRLMEYLLRESANGGIVWNNFSNTTAEGITEELMALDQGRTKYLAYHLMLSFPSDETQQWKQNRSSLLEDLKQRFRIFRMVAADHQDKDHYHIHIAVFAQTEKGRKLPLETIQDGRAIAVAPSLRKFAEDWEDRIGARKTGREQPEMSVSKETLEMALREYQQGRSDSPIPTKVQLKSDIQRIIAEASSFEELESNASAQQVEICYKRDDAGKIIGISFSREGTAIRGRDAGYSYAALTQKFYETNETHGGCRPVEHLAGHPDQSNYRATTSGSGRAKRTPQRAKPTASDASRKPNYEYGANHPDHTEFEKIFGLLMHAPGRPANLMQILSFLINALSKETPYRAKPYAKKINL